jgi:hypothetical protein
MSARIGPGAGARLGDFFLSAIAASTSSTPPPAPSLTSGGDVAAAAAAATAFTSHRRNAAARDPCAAEVHDGRIELVRLPRPAADVGFTVGDAHALLNRLIGPSVSSRGTRVDPFPG